MMKIAFNILPLKRGHRNRGVGNYTLNLLGNLRKRHDIFIQEFERTDEVKDADLIHYPWFDLFYKTLPLWKKFPSVVTIHDVIPLIFPKEYSIGIKGKINLGIQKIALKYCKQLITVSQTSKKDIIKYLGVEEDKINVVYSAADNVFKTLPDESLLQVKRKLKLPDRYLLYVGDGNYNKNLPLLIKGFKKIKEDLRFIDLKLVLIGGVFLKKLDNIEHPELKSLKQAQNMIVTLDLESDIIRPGKVESGDLACIYNLATVYIQPSLYEGFGFPILEAFSCGTPVVSSNSPSLREIGGGGAIYFDPRNIDQFVNTVVEVLQSSHLQDKLSKLGLRRVSEFSWEKTADETVKVYKKSIQG